MMNPTSHFVTIDDFKLHYVDWGDNGPDVLMLHGDLRTSRSWDAVARQLAPSYHVLSLDYKGHGDSDWPRRGYRFSQRVDELHAFCEAVGLKDATAVGHSTGGVIMTLMAEKYPGTFSKLVMLEPMIHVDEEFQRMVSSRRENHGRTVWDSREELYDYLKKHHAAGRWRDDVIRDVVEHEAYEMDDGKLDMKWSIDSMNWEERDGEYYELVPIFESLGLPILFMCSSRRRNQFRDLDPLAGANSNFDIVTIEDSDHNMYMERPDEVAGAIGDFLNAAG
ncbi:MAG: alpha/beta hydrolase [Chloroflexi bacterium]|nr:alpha/beta hydrolase [Chloroflexota bacterium]